MARVAVPPLPTGTWARMLEPSMNTTLPLKVTCCPYTEVTIVPPPARAVVVLATFTSRGGFRAPEDGASWESLPNWAL